MANITILGAGTWGSALGRMFALGGHTVTLWSAISAELDALQSMHTHRNLPGVLFPESIRCKADLQTALQGAGFVIFAVPSVYVRSVAKAAAPFLSSDSILVSVAKGMEAQTFLTMTEIIAEETGADGRRIVALSGPTHAEEVARDLPTAIVSASEDRTAAEAVQRTFSNDVFRVYTNTDARGVELCGAMKNIIALAAGVSDGIGYGDNAKAGIITRGMAEIARLGTAMGCDRATFYGLAGVGDLIVTATSRHSRNNRAGFLMGSGKTAEQAVKEVGMVVEGLHALPAAVGLSAHYGVELPITFAVDAIVHGADPKTVVNGLMNRAYKNEA